MPPKRGRGRGRGGPPDRRELPLPAATERPGGPSDRRELTSPSTTERPGRDQRPLHEETIRRHPLPEQQIPEVQPVRERTAEARKPRTVHPEELGIELKQKLALSTLAAGFPRNPGQGQLGRRIRLISNCFPIEIPSGNIYHYDVDIVNKRNVSETGTGAAAPLSVDKKYRCLSTKRNREIVNLMLQNDRNFQGLFAAYDGRKNLYTRHALKMETIPLKCEIVIPDENPGDPADPRGARVSTFIVCIQPVRKKDSDSCAINLDSLHALFAGKVTSINQEAVMALETVLRHGPCLRYTPVNRSFFYKPHPDEVHPLGGGREIWFGYHQSLRLGQWRPMVNIDITATTFYEKKPILNYIADFMKTSVDGLRHIPSLRDSDIKRISKELKSMQIEVNHLRNYRRKYRILRLTRESANRLSFPLDINGRRTEMTVAEYFRGHHNRRLEFGHLPCLQVNPETKKVYLPLEVCDMVEGQHCKKKLEDRQNAEMIKFTARAPRDRFNEIRDIIRTANYNQDDHLREFGMRVYCEPLKLEGRVLEAPNVQYKTMKSPDLIRIKPKDGSWDMRDKEFFRPAVIQNWVLLSFAHPRFCSLEMLNTFAQMLCRVAHETGITMSRPELIDIKNPASVRVETVLKDVKRKFNAELAVVVVPAAHKTIYGDVKQAAETEIGLCTQCIKDENVKRCKPALVSNLCQKINAKMGGINNALTPGEKPKIMSRPVIIIGADVTHPGPSQDVKPSLAAAVGSLDAHPSRYAVTCKAQTNVDEKKQAMEIILDLKDMVIDLLKAFYRNTKGKKPEKIIFYRDGVSEGQFEKVREHEVRCIREACRSLGEDYQPGITFIVVQKRHHTRFMPEDSREGTGRMRNMPPGTTVDTTVTHPLNFDFFLCSHFGLQGMKSFYIFFKNFISVFIVKNILLCG
ncbi:protein argonaute-3-like [Stegodyphus dumicola]|uniref:protein argonaute-3-like n=1 Tax=Stegodyphus dumicola TaxID=202533 RepID=UPI0015AD237E|nr:protein argonaute-3-like [Stegodyphus dumicola]